MSNPAEFTRPYRLVVVWLLIGTAVFLGVQAVQERSRRERIVFDEASGAVELRRGRDGHYHWPGTLNGVGVDFLVDTGATATAIPRPLAERLGLREEGGTLSSTAGGVVDARFARANIALQGGPRVEQARVTVLSRLEAPLLGMDVLSKLRFTQGDGVLRIEPGHSR
jgi:aspartyl protease family protein